MRVSPVCDADVCHLLGIRQPTHEPINQHNVLFRIMNAILTHDSVIVISSVSFIQQDKLPYPLSWQHDS
jgi:hypothetical protein